MKNFFFFLISSFCATIFVVVLLGLTIGDATVPVMHNIDGPVNRLTRDTNLALDQDQRHEQELEKGVATTAAAILEDDATGSSLPDCSHACGACFPCKRITVSFKCSTTEPCPVVYRCLCKGRFFHVPST
ncbi:unnamed protein product [Victoria cruziana]